jgi:hypothetical protein
MKDRFGYFFGACAAALLMFGASDGSGAGHAGDGLHAARRHALGQRRRHDLRRLHLHPGADPDGRGGQPIHYNGFNLTRAYINVTGQINHLIQFRITPTSCRRPGERPHRGHHRDARLSAQVWIRAVELQRLHDEGRGSASGSSRRRTSISRKASTAIGSPVRSSWNAKAS